MCSAANTHLLVHLQALHKPYICRYDLYGFHHKPEEKNHENNLCRYFYNSFFDSASRSIDAE